MELRIISTYTSQCIKYQKDLLKAGCSIGINIGSPVDLLEHGLQTGTRALESGCDEETAVCALLHDIGEVLAPACHGEVGKTYLESHYVIQFTCNLEQYRN